SWLWAVLRAAFSPCMVSAGEHTPTSKIALCDALCGPKAFRLTLIVALGRSARCILILRGMRAHVRERT
ncbi:MAG: hypothetical protein MUQ30_04440, partial [Anaerolineae bacterium]|nr:hypothetical protein [Anaerolineae bacterium]